MLTLVRSVEKSDPLQLAWSWSGLPTVARTQNQASAGWQVGG